MDIINILALISLVVSVPGMALWGIGLYTGVEGAQRVGLKALSTGVTALFVLGMAQDQLRELGAWVTAHSFQIFKSGIWFSAVSLVLGAKCLKNQRRGKGRRCGGILVLVGCGAAVLAGLAGIVYYAAKGAEKMQKAWNMLFLNPPVSTLEWVVIVATATMITGYILSAVVRVIVCDKVADKIMFGTLVPIMTVCGCIAVALWF